MAEQQDWALVRDVLEYRVAAAAVSLFNAPKQSFDSLSRQPAMVRMLARMARAQRGLPLDGAAAELEQEGLAVAAAHRVEPEVED